MFARLGDTLIEPRYYYRKKGRRPKALDKNLNHLHVASQNGPNRAEIETVI